MQTTDAHIQQTLEVKRSKFIAHLFPYPMFDAVMASLREEHPKARHFVSAFRYVNSFDQIVEGCSDDGEPRGTSGKPTLAVLQGSELINVGIITVRYFGGIKLGPGGLVRAYGDAANLAISHAPLSGYVKEFDAAFACDYSAVGIVEYELGQKRVQATRKDFGASEVLWEVRGTQNALEELFAVLGRQVRRSL